VRIHVVAAIIQNKKKILIVQRKPDCKREPNKWEFPGGKAEEGEGAQEALKREISEELGVEIFVEELFGESAKKYEERGEEMVISFYFAKLIGRKKPKAIGCQSMKWISVEKLGEHDFADADRIIVELLMVEDRNNEEEE